MGVIKAFKGFTKDLKCLSHQYEIGKSYEVKGKTELCRNGFHSCENPLHVLRYYGATENNRFCEVEVDGEIVKANDDSKIASSKITIKAEITLKSLIESGFKFIFEKIKWGDKDTPQTHGYSSAAQTHGDSSAAQTHGDSSAAQTHGDYSAAQTHGDSSAAQTHGNSSAAQTHGNSSAAQTHGKESIACSTGISGKASGIVGNWLVLSEWKQDKKGLWIIASVKTARVDGKKIKADTWYCLKNGKFKEVK
jgi:hypothetical protein